MRVRRHYLSLALLLIVGAAAIIAASALVFAQDRSHMDHARHVHGSEATVPTMPGQEAFGTIQEIVRSLDADPTTDWSKVSIGALREHLIDMDDVTMRARAVERPLADGVEITVTGQGRTLAAIKRMVPAHAQELAVLGWSARTEDQPGGVKFTVTASDPREIAMIKALGFMGIMVQGAHHQDASSDDGQRRVGALEGLRIARRLRPLQRPLSLCQFATLARFRPRHEVACRRRTSPLMPDDRT